MAIKSYTAVTQTFRLGRVIPAGESIELDEDLARGDKTLREQLLASTSQNSQGAPTGGNTVEPSQAQPEATPQDSSQSSGAAQTSSEAGTYAPDAPQAPETGEAGDTGASDTGSSADQTSSTDGGQAPADGTDARGETAGDKTTGKPKKSQAKKAE